MTVLVCGVSHKSASVGLREQLAFSKQQTSLIIEQLVSLPQVSQAILLITCNRTEVYCDAQDSEYVIAVLAEFAGLAFDEVQKASYCYQDLTAVEHAMRVACGLDSLVVGESEVLGQMKEAVRLANSAQGLDQRFHALFQRVFALAKQVRSSTEIGVCPVSVASIAVQFIQKHHTTTLDKAHIVLLGAGQTMSLALKYLAKQSWGQLTVLSRTEANARILAEPFDADYGSFDSITSAINQADIVLSATSSESPIVTQDALACITDKPRVMIDMAMPRDIDPDIKTCPDTTLYTIDDLSQVAHQHVESRHAAQQAAVMIRQQAQEYMNWLESLSDLNLVKIFRRHVDQTRQQELDKAKQMLLQGEDPEAVLERLAYSLSNKLMHEPTVQMRQASLNGRQDVLETLQDIFDLCPTD